MRAIVFPAANQVELQLVADPACAEDEVVIEVATAGICGTDLHIFRGEYMSGFPLIPGHEFGGRVVEVGRAVSGLRVGDRVAPASVSQVGASPEISRPQVMLIGSEMYSNGAMTDACVVL